MQTCPVRGKIIIIFLVYWYKSSSSILYLEFIDFVPLYIHKYCYPTDVAVSIDEVDTMSLESLLKSSAVEVLHKQAMS